MLHRGYNTEWPVGDIQGVEEGRRGSCTVALFSFCGVVVAGLAWWGWRETHIQAKHKINTYGWISTSTSHKTHQNYHHRVVSITQLSRHKIPSLFMYLCVVLE